MTLPSQSLPKCYHGLVIGCQECSELKRLAGEKLQPLADEFWEYRGEHSIEHLLYRAYLLGRSSVEEAKTAREQELEDMLRSARCIAERRGVDTAWETFSNRIGQLGIGAVTPRVFKTPKD